LATIDTLVKDIESLFDGGGVLDDTNLGRFAEALTENFTKRFKRYGEVQGKSKLYLSNVGKPLRQLWYQIKSDAPREELRAQKKLNFLFGDILEDLLLLLAVEAGHEVTFFQHEVELDGIRGRIDCFIDGCLVDVKSASSRSFDKFRDGTLRGNDPFGYIAQLAGYSTALGGVDGYFLVIDKQFGHVCLLRIPKEELEAYNVRGRIVDARAALDKDTPPVDLCHGGPVPDGVSKTAPFGNGNFVLPTGCSYCDHKHSCWAQQGVKLRTFIYANGPKFFTTVKSLPKVIEVTKQEEDNSHG